MALFEPVTHAGRRAFDVIAGRPDETLVALDFDGTLAPIVDDPARAFPDPAALRAFGRLGGLVGQVAIVTGREIKTCVNLGGFGSVAGLEDLIVLGQYGVEQWRAASGRYDIPAAPPAVRRVAQELPAVLAAAGYPNARLEDKKRAIGVHTRELAEPQAAFDALAGPVTELAHRHGLQVEPGRFVLEIRAASSDKGRALRKLVERTGSQIVVYGGDDLGDLAAFEALDDMREVIGVRLYAASEEQQALAEQADVVCQATPGIAAWLDAAADAIEARPER